MIRSSSTSETEIGPPLVTTDTDVMPSGQSSIYRAIKVTNPDSATIRESASKKALQMHASEHSLEKKEKKEQDSFNLFFPCPWYLRTTVVVYRPFLWSLLHRIDAFLSLFLTCTHYLHFAAFAHFVVQCQSASTILVTTATRANKNSCVSAVCWGGHKLLSECLDLATACAYL
jgi:hypothetical protein